MSCFLFSLRFTAPVHFGLSDAAMSLYASEETFRADTLFSALCHTALHAEGEAGVTRLCEAVRRGKLTLSDAMPYCGDTFYLPKPFIHAPSSEELPARQRKTMKKLRWLPVHAFERFSVSVHGGAAFVPETAEGFGVHEDYTKAAVTDGEDANPYQVGVFRFFEDCGLWFMLCCPEEDGPYYETLLRLLGMSGIGGKTSAGYGSFEIEDVIFLDEPFDDQTEWLHDALARESNSYLLLTTALPETEDLEAVLEGAYYQLTRRGGFIQSETYAAEPQKKDTQYFLAAGSVLKRKFSGGLFNVGESGKHPVYRYSAPVLLGGIVMIHEGQLEVFDLTLTAKAPVFIGSGKSYVKKEYVFLTPRFARVSCDEVMLLDETKFFHLLLERKLEDKYTQFMLGAQTDLYRFLTAECCLSLNDIRAVSRYSIAAADALDAEHSLKEINAFVRGADGRVYVPGSSVKGALRTAILTDWILSDNSPHSAFGDTRKGFPEGTYLHTLKLKKDRNDAVLDDAVNSILRGLSISDSLPVSDTCMILAGKIDADPDGQTHRINLCRECIRPGTKLHFKLTLDQSVLHQKITAEGLMRSIRTFDSFYEKAYLRHFTAPRHAAEVSYDNTLFLGGGVGFFSKTLTYPYLGEKDGLQAAINELSRSFRKHRHEEDRADGISPRTIKYALYEGELYPYGLCEVKIS